MIRTKRAKREVLLELDWPDPLYYSSFRSEWRQAEEMLEQSSIMSIIFARRLTPKGFSLYNSYQLY